MYQKYHTEALVLGGASSGEADRILFLYTREFGLVRARAYSIRSERSKMRFALQDYSHATVSLVRGKSGWRAAGASALRTATGDPRAVAAFARVSQLVLRLVQGEEANEYLFAALREAHVALMSASGKEGSDVSGIIEIVCVARVLFALGYISNEALSSALFTHTAYTGESLVEAETLKDRLLLSINRAIAETQL